MLVSDIASAYITLRDIDNRLLISEKTAETWKANLDIVTARQRAGFVSEVDLNMAKIQLFEAQTAIQIIYTAAATNGKCHLPAFG